MELARAAAALTATLGLTFAALPAPAQPNAAQALVGSAWCHEPASGLSMQWTRLRFQADGMMQVRQEFDLANGSNNSKSTTARWELAPNLLIIHEPNGNQYQSRLPMAFAASGRQVTLGEPRYSACR
jgi:hypothetical protein